jgi:hypothetical protein
MKNFILYTLLFLGLVALYKMREPELKQYEAYRCAVYGYEADCKTPLPAERRLK